MFGRAGRGEIKKVNAQQSFQFFQYWKVDAVIYLPFAAAVAVLCLWKPAYVRKRTKIVLFSVMTAAFVLTTASVFLFPNELVFLLKIVMNQSALITVLPGCMP